MEIRKLNISELTPNEWNPNIIDKRKFNILVSNIKRDGMLQPILVRKVGDSHQIIDGYHRWKASKKAGLKDITCIIVASDDEEAKLKTLSFNTLRGENDEAKLKSLLNGLLVGLKLDDLELATGLLRDDIAHLLEDTTQLDKVFPEIEFDENLLVKNTCPKCGYEW